jgi:hypothetical protein
MPYKMLMIGAAIFGAGVLLVLVRIWRSKPASSPSPDRGAASRSASPAYRSTPASSLPSDVSLPVQSGFPSENSARS